MAWMSNVNSTRASEGWLYLAVVMDLYSRTITVWF